MAKGTVLLKSVGEGRSFLLKFLKFLSSGGLEYINPLDGYVYVFDESSDYENYRIMPEVFLDKILRSSSSNPVDCHIWCSLGSSVSSTIYLDGDGLVLEGWIDTVSNDDVCKVVSCFFNIAVEDKVSFYYSLVDTINRYEGYDWKSFLEKGGGDINSRCDFIIIKEGEKVNLSSMEYKLRGKIGAYDYFIWSESINGCRLPTEVISPLLPKILKES